MVKDYISGKTSLEDVMVEMEKANISISYALTVVNTLVQTGKEILQMQV